MKYLLENAVADNVGYEVERVIYYSLDEAKKAYHAALNDKLEEVRIDNNLSHDEMQSYIEEVVECSGTATGEEMYDAQDPDGEWYVRLYAVH